MLNSAITTNKKCYFIYIKEIPGKSKQRGKKEN